MNDRQMISKTEEEWKRKLTPEEYAILRGKSTEAAFSGTYLNTKEKGIYICKACGNKLFSSKTKFDSGTGWPSFDDVIQKENIVFNRDQSFSLERTEVVCAGCGSHLGHVFDDDRSATGKRYCINSISLTLAAAKKKHTIY